MGTEMQELLFSSWEDRSHYEKVHGNRVEALNGLLLVIFAIAILLIGTQRHQVICHLILI
jgi:hypothetical protein